MRATRGGKTERWTPPPFDADALQAAALRYVGRFATTRAKLVQYLRRKLRERGWAGEAAPDPDGVADRLVALGYIDDAGFAASRARAGAAKGVGARRLADTLRHDGIADEIARPLVDGHDAVAAALRFARKKRLGPWGPPLGDPKLRHRQLATMARGGHASAVARAVLAAPTVEAAEALAEAG